MKIILPSTQSIATQPAAQWIFAPDGGLEVADIVNISTAMEIVTAYGGPPRCKILLSFRDGYGYNPPGVALARRGMGADMSDTDSYRSPWLSFQTLLPYPKVSFRVIGTQPWDEPTINVHASIYGLPGCWEIHPDMVPDLGLLIDFHLAMRPIIPTGLGPALAQVLRQEKEAAVLHSALQELGFVPHVQVERLPGQNLYQCWVGGEPVRSMRPDLRYSVMALLIAVSANRTATQRSYTGVGILEYPEIGFRPEVVIRTVLSCRNLHWLIISRQQEPPGWTEPVVKWEAEA